MSSTTDIVSSFIQGAPPGELNDVVNDIKTLTSDQDPALISKLKPAFQKYNEDQLVTVKLPGASQPVIISQYNRLDDNKYFDTESQTSFDFDPINQKASNSQSHTHESKHIDLTSSILRSLSTHFAEHYPPNTTSSSAYTVCPASDNSSIAILLSTTKSSPQNFLSGRWRSTFLYNPTDSSLTGTIHINVHYYEDGNVALSTTKKVNVDSAVENNGEAIVRKIASIEKQYQEEVNRAFVGMNESGFKGLRRQLPVTRQRVEWEKIRGYGLGGDLRGESKR